MRVSDSAVGKRRSSRARTVALEHPLRDQTREGSVGGQIDARADPASETTHGPPLIPDEPRQGIGPGQLQVRDRSEGQLEIVELTHENVVRLGLRARLKEVEEELLAMRIHIQVASERSAARESFVSAGYVR